MYTHKDIIRFMNEPAPNDSNENMIAIIKEKTLKEPYRKPQYQLFHLLSGFGINPSKMGNACFGYFCADGEEARMERYDFIGIANPEITQIALALEKQWSNKDN